MFYDPVALPLQRVQREYFVPGGFSYDKAYSDCRQVEWSLCGYGRDCIGDQQAAYYVVQCLFSLQTRKILVTWLLYVSQYARPSPTENYP